MEKLSKYGRRMRITMIKSLLLAGFLCLVAVPFVKKELLNVDIGYYTVKINGVEVGTANSESEAKIAYATARKNLSSQYSDVVYMNPEVEIVKEEKSVAQRMNEEELSNAIYSCMFDNVMEIDMNLAYTVRIDDIMVTLETEDAVVELFRKIISKYDLNNAFDVNIVSVDSSTGSYELVIKERTKENSAAEIVASAIGGTAVSEDGKSTIGNTGLKSIEFEEDILISGVSTKNAKITSVEEAYESITKEHAEKTIYTVQSGDCISAIAASNGLSMNELFDLNEGLTETSIIVPGDSLVVTVPASDITVVTKYEMAYEEDFEAEPIYKDDETSYRGTNTILEEGTVGHRSVVAEVTYTNGNETKRTYSKENITKESTPKVISVGVLTPPTYIKPMYGGQVSAYFGYGLGYFHGGIDWYIGVGNPVFASCDGVVTRAGWYSTYGYCVDIVHSDGNMTRYAHLNSINCSVGERVSQRQTIGYSGNTGYSTGPHLHFEIWVGGTRVNPLNYVNK